MKFMETNNLVNPANAPETKEVYEAPVVKTVAVKVEHGVQMYLSGPGGDPNSENNGEGDPSSY